MTTDCPTCAPPPVCGCDDPFSLYSLVGAAYTNSQKSFRVPCPPGFLCGPGWPIVVPVVITWNPPPIPQCPSGNCDPFILRLHCCQSDVVHTVPYNVSDAEYAAIVGEMLNECAAQQAICDAIVTYNPQPKPQPPPTISILGQPPSVCVESAYSFTLSASGGIGPYVFSLLSGSLPDGLSLSSSGVISGTTGTTSGGFAFVVGVSGSSGAGQRTLTINVVEITNDSLASGDVDVPYSDTLNQTGGSPPVAWSVDSGVLPDGLTLDASTGEISGTPTTDESQEIIFQMEDSDGLICQKTLTIEIGGEWTIDGTDECTAPGVDCLGIHFSVAPTNGCIETTCADTTPVIISSFDVTAQRTFGPFATDKDVSVSGSASGTIPVAVCGPSSVQTYNGGVDAFGLTGYSGGFFVGISSHDGGVVAGSFNLTGTLPAGNTFTVLVEAEVGIENAVDPTPVISGTVNITDS